ncbi:MAG: hypothetical protein ACJ8GN_03360 [Longimicrobiaceae bacterium]
MPRHILTALFFAAACVPVAAAAQTWRWTRTPVESDTAIAGAYTDVWSVMPQHGDRLRVRVGYAAQHPVVWLVSPAGRRVWKARFVTDSVWLNRRVAEAGLWHIVLRQPAAEGPPSYSIEVQVEGGHADTLVFAPHDDAHVLGLFAPGARSDPNITGTAVPELSPDVSVAQAPRPEPKNWRYMAIGLLLLLTCGAGAAAWQIGETVEDEGVLFDTLSEENVFETLSFEGFSRWAIAAAAAAGAAAVVWTEHASNGFPVVLIVLVLAVIAMELTLRRPDFVALQSLLLLAAGAVVAWIGLQPLRAAEPSISVLGELIVVAAGLWILAAVAGAMWRGIPEMVENGVVVSEEKGEQVAKRVDGQMPRFEWATSVAFGTVGMLALARILAVHVLGGKSELSGYPILYGVLQGLVWSGTASAFRITALATVAVVLVYILLIGFRSADYPSFPQRIIPPPARSQASGLLAAVYLASDGFWAAAVAVGDLVLRTFVFVGLCAVAVAVAGVFVGLLYIIRTMVVAVAGIWVCCIAASLVLAGAAVGALGEAVARVVDVSRGRPLVLVYAAAAAGALSVAMGLWTLSEEALARFARGAVAVATCAFITSAILVVIASVARFGGYHVGALTYACGALLVISLFHRPGAANTSQAMTAGRGVAGLMLSVTYLIASVFFVLFPDLTR